MTIYEIEIHRLFIYIVISIITILYIYYFIVLDKYYQTNEFKNSLITEYWRDIENIPINKISKKTNDVSVIYKLRLYENIRKEFIKIQSLYDRRSAFEILEHIGVFIRDEFQDKCLHYLCDMLLANRNLIPNLYEWEALQEDLDQLFNINIPRYIYICAYYYNLYHYSRINMIDRALEPFLYIMNTYIQNSRYNKIKQILNNNLNCDDIVNLILDYIDINHKKNQRLFNLL